MKRSNHRGADRADPARPAGSRRHGVSTEMFHPWTAKCGGMDVSETTRLLDDAVLDSRSLKDLFGRTW